MTMQRLCHARTAIALVGMIAICASGESVFAEASAHNYPTEARVEYVNECIGKSGGKLASLYRCSCVIDAIAQTLTYDEFVEATTYARYANLPGEAGGVFRDSDKGRALAKRFREIEADAYQACGQQN